MTKRRAIKIMKNKFWRPGVYSMQQKITAANICRYYGIYIMHSRNWLEHRSAFPGRRFCFLHSGRVGKAMIVVGKNIYAIVPNDDPFVQDMRRFDLNYIDLKYWGRIRNPDGSVAVGYQWWGIGLDTVEANLDIEATWYCPD